MFEFNREYYNNVKDELWITTNLRLLYLTNCENITKICNSNNTNLLELYFMKMLFATDVKINELIIYDDEFGDLIIYDDVTAIAQLINEYRI